MTSIENRKCCIYDWRENIYYIEVSLYLILSELKHLHQRTILPGEYMPQVSKNRHDGGKLLLVVVVNIFRHFSQYISTESIKISFLITSKEFCCCDDNPTAIEREQRGAGNRSPGRFGIDCGLIQKDEKQSKPQSQDYWQGNGDPTSQFIQKCCVEKQKAQYMCVFVVQVKYIR